VYLAVIQNQCTLKPELSMERKASKSKRSSTVVLKEILWTNNLQKKHQILIVRLKKEIRVSNIDESPNKSGPIRFETRLLTKIDGKTISTRYLISDIGKEDIILGLPWLERVNPKVDWIKKSIKIIPKRMNPLTLRQGID
jgi:hypothetical protein